MNGFGLGLVGFLCVGWHFTFSLRSCAQVHLPDVTSLCKYKYIVRGQPRTLNCYLIWCCSFCACCCCTSIIKKNQMLNLQLQFAVNPKYQIVCAAYVVCIWSALFGDPLLLFIATTKTPNHKVQIQHYFYI